MLNQLPADRTYEPGDPHGSEYFDRPGCRKFPHRRLVQRELKLLNEIWMQVCAPFDDRWDETVRQLQGLSRAAEGSDDEKVKEAARAAKGAAIRVEDLRLDEALAQQAAGYMTGLREGFRLGAALLGRVGSGCEPVPAEMLIRLAGALTDDAAADRFIGRLIVGAEPEFIQATFPGTEAKEAADTAEPPESN